MSADDIFKAVLEAMQNAEEHGGPERAEYVQLMHKIEAEARRRADAAQAGGAA